MLFLNVITPFLVLVLVLVCLSVDSISLSPDGSTISQPPSSRHGLSRPVSIYSAQIEDGFYGSSSVGESDTGSREVEEDRGGGGGRSSRGIQFMITQRMRRVLEDELGYLVEEVDCMEPQIAAVVIERGLARPSNGMPISWQRPARNVRASGRNLITVVGSTLNSLISKVVSTFGTAARKFVPIGLALCAIPLGIHIASSKQMISARRQVRENVSRSTSSLLQRATSTTKTIKEVGRRSKETTPSVKRRAPSVTSSTASSSSSGISRPSVTVTRAVVAPARAPKSEYASAAISRQNSKINFKALDSVQKTSLLDELIVSVLVMKKRFFAPKD